MGWLETVAVADALCPVRRKVVLFPTSMPMAAINTQVVIEINLKNAPDATGFSTDFALWLRDGLTSHMQAIPVDTRRDEGPFAVHQPQEGQDLIVECARIAAQAALATSAAHRLAGFPSGHLMMTPKECLPRISESAEIAFGISTSDGLSATRSN